MKKAFTLVEILVSIALIGLISIFISSTIFQTKKNNEFFKNHVEKESKIHKYEDILYRDLLQSYALSIERSKRYSIIYFRSKNTIYDISNPYVIWLVLKKDNTLIRLESSREIKLPISEEKQKYIFMNVVQKNCQAFQVLLSKNKKDILVYIDIKNHKPSIFEIAKI